MVPSSNALHGVLHWALYTVLFYIGESSMNRDLITNEHFDLELECSLGIPPESIHVIPGNTYQARLTLFTTLN